MCYRRLTMLSGSQSSKRCVFVGNIPYDATEEQLKQICEEVGPVVHFRLVIDRETGKPKGYGFCEYTDEETALSARRNLQGYEINGRQLRVDFAENDKNADRNKDQVRGGNGTVSNPDSQRQFGGKSVMGDNSFYQPMGVSTAIAAATSMAKALGAAQTTNIQNQMGIQSQPLGSDPLTLHLAKMSRVQLSEIMVELKAMATQNKEELRQVLLRLPHLTKAIFQAQLMLGMVTQQMLQMPSILQTATLPLHPLLPDTRFQKQPAQVVPGLPPLLPNSQFTLANTQNTAGPSPFSVYNEAQNQVLQHAHLPTESGISALHSVQQQLSSSVVSRPNLPSGPSSSLKQQNMGAAIISGPKHQVQLPPDVESALLQQVMSLTPEQISSMPLDQQQQVTQMQQFLRQST